MIDVSLVRGIPTLLQTMKAVLNDLVAERYQVFELMPQYNSEMYQTIRGMLEKLPGGTISQQELQEVMLRPRPWCGRGILAAAAPWCSTRPPGWTNMWSGLTAPLVRREIEYGGYPSDSGGGKRRGALIPTGSRGS